MPVEPYEVNPNADSIFLALDKKPEPKTFGKTRKKTEQTARHIQNKIAKRRRKNKVARASRRRNRI